MGIVKLSKGACLMTTLKDNSSLTRYVTLKKLSPMLKLEFDLLNSIFSSLILAVNPSSK
jgi:hypothetical protein